MTKKLIPFFVFFLCCFFSKAQSQTANLSGIIFNQEDNQPILGANVSIKNTSYGTVSNIDGEYDLKLPLGEYEIYFSYLGFEDEVKKINLQKDTQINIYLVPKEEELEEILVEENVERTEIRSASMSTNRLTSETIKQIPVVLGEADVIRALIQLPGVSNTGEGSAGFNVRGGSAGQNLILVDNATIFNSSHLFGLFSIFNPDAVKELSLYKGGIPATYGGRVASVLDIEQRRGNTQKFKGEANIGVVSSKLLLEGPIQKDKSSFLVSGRSSYAHLFLQLADNPNSAYFYDVNAKFNFIINPENDISVSAYYGRDVIDINDNFINVFGSSFVSARWNHKFNNEISGNLSLIANDYLYDLEITSAAFVFETGLSNINLKYDVSHRLNTDLSIEYGIESLLHEFNPGLVRPTDALSDINRRKLDNKFAWENGIYLSANHNLTKDLQLQYGLRLSSFFRLGQNGFSTYENDEPVFYNSEIGIYEEAPILESTSISRNETIKSFHNLEPRFSMSYSFNDNQSVKLGYHRMVQNLHLISNTSAPTPFDIWAPSGPYLQPQKADQVAVGYFQNLKKEAYSIETEVYYKTVQNSFDFINGANLIANNNIERVLLNGEGRAYGLEILLKKNKGKLTGWIAYTLSRTEQRTPGRSPDEPGINNGEWYLNNFDKTHDLSVIANYQLNKKWSFNANFVAQTGLPVNFPVGQYQFQDLNIPVFEGRNQNRLPTFHRLDISATLIPSKNESRDWKTSWNFGIYNLYNRMNAASINFRQNQETGANEAIRLSIFGIVPSVSYNIKF